MIDEIRIFLRVLQEGSFSAAARSLGASPSMISKNIARLEKRLNVSLFERIAGNIRTTQEAEIFKYEAQKILNAVQSAEESLAIHRSKVAGTVRIHTALPTAKYLIAPILPELFEQYPFLKLEFTLEPRRGDFLEDKIDLAIHSGRPTELSLIGRPLMSRPWTIAAAPSYIEKFGKPQSPKELSRHRCLNFSIWTHWNSWTFREDGLISSVDDSNTLISANQGELLRTLALQGLGIVRLAHFHIKDDIKKGNLVPLLEKNIEQSLDDQFYLLYPKKKQTLRARVVIDFLYERLVKEQP